MATILPGGSGLTEKQESSVDLASSEHVDGNEGEGLDGTDVYISVEACQGQGLGMVVVRGGQMTGVSLRTDGEHEILDSRGDIMGFLPLSAPSRDVVGQPPATVSEVDKPGSLPVSGRHGMIRGEGPTATANVESSVSTVSGSTFGSSGWMTGG